MTSVPGHRATKCQLWDGHGKTGSHWALMCLYSPQTAGQLWNFSATTAGTSVKGSAGDRGEGAEWAFLVCQNRARKCLCLLHHSPQIIT